MRKSKRDKFSIILISILAFLAIGYAYLTTSLSINGTSNINAASWNVHFENVNVTEGSVTTVTQAPTIDTNLTTINYSITLSKPGDYYEFTVDVKNSGTIDAMISSVTSTINGMSPGELPVYLNYSATYSDGLEIQDNQLLASNTKETYKIRIEYNPDISPSDLPQDDTNANITVGFNYKQADGYAVTVNHPIPAEELLLTNPDGETPEEKSPYVDYNGEIYRVLYDINSTYGWIEIVSDNPVKSVSIGNKTTNFFGE